MALFDFVKKKPENPASNLPTFKNSGQSPESFSNFQFSEAENGNLSPQKPQNQGFQQNYQEEWQRTPYVPVQQKDPSQKIRTATNQAMQAKSENPVAKKVQDGEDVFKALLDSRYKEDEASLKRQRAAEFWGNVANLFGQTVSSAAGARIFPQIKSNTQQYNAALDKLRDGYNDTLLNYTLANAKADRAAKAEQAKIQLQFERDKALTEIKANLDAGLIDRKTAGTLAAQAQKATQAKDLQKIKDDAAMQRARYNQGAATARTKMTNDAAMQREKMRQDRLDGRSGTSGKKEKYPRVKFGDSDKTYDINRSTEVAEMYNEGVRRGDFPPIMNMDTSNPTTIENMRQIILQNTGKKKAVSSTNEGWSLTDEENDNGWSLKD